MTQHIIVLKLVAIFTNPPYCLNLIKHIKHFIIPLLDFPTTTYI